MPQHFQQLTSRFERLIQNTVASAAPFFWGVLNFEYDHSALVNGILRVLCLEAVLQDGLCIRAGSSAGIDLELNLKPFSDQAQAGSLTIYLVVPGQAALSTRGDLARYSSYQSDATVDETTGEDGIAIPRLRPRVALWAGDLPPSRFQSVPIFRVHAQGDAFGQSEYAPPCLAVDPASELGKRCADTLSVMRTKAYLLAQQWRASDANRDAAERHDLQSKINALSTGLPYAEASLQCGRVHPFAMYLAMCQLAGGAACITAALVPPQFRVYQHNELLQTFAPLLAFIRGAVSDAAAESWTVLPFSGVDGRFEAGPDLRLDEVLSRPGTLIDPQIVLGLRPSPGISDDTIWRWGEGCVVATTSLIPTFLSNRVSGAERRRADRIAGLVPRRGTVLLPLLLDDAVAKPGEPLCLVERFANEGRPVEAVLYLRRQEQSKGN